LGSSRDNQDPNIDIDFDININSNRNNISMNNNNHANDVHLDDREYLRLLFDDGLIPLPELHAPDGLVLRAEVILGAPMRERLLPDHGMYLGWLPTPIHELGHVELRRYLNANAETPEDHVMRRDFERMVRLRTDRPLRRWCNQHRGAYQIPEHIESDRMYTFPNTGDEDFLCGVSPYVSGFGTAQGARLMARQSHFHSARTNYRQDGDIEQDVRVHQREEWLCIRRKDRVVSWLDLEIFRSNESWNAVVWDNQRNAPALVDNGLHIRLTEFPPADGVLPREMIHDMHGVPEGLSVPRILSLRYYAARIRELSIANREPEDAVMVEADAGDRAVRVGVGAGAALGPRAVLEPAGAGSACPIGSVHGRDAP